MLTVIEEYSAYYPQSKRGHVRLKVQPARGRVRAAPRCRPHPHRNRARDKLKHRFSCTASIKYSPNIAPSMHPVRFFLLCLNRSHCSDNLSPCRGAM